MESLERYKRQLDIQGWGVEAQERIRQATACVAGVGGLGSPVSLYLAAAGVGNLVLCDYQTVELSNLNRQILYDTADIGAPKLERARERLRAVNPDIHIILKHGKITDATAAEIFAGADIVVDCLDNFAARFILNRYAVLKAVPFVHAGITSLYGQVAVLFPPRTPCLQCFIPTEASAPRDPPPVLGATAGVVGSIQAVEALKILAGINEDSYGVLRTVDLMTCAVDSIVLEKNPSCPVCSNQSDKPGFQ